MYRIGILGTENSHAAAFADIVNTPGSKYEYEFRVAALYAHEKAPSEAIKAKHPDSGIVICDSIEQMLPLVDCVMVTARDGKYHKDFALPFIRAGKPAFIDKPFTTSVGEAQALVAEAAALNVPISGGSGCKYSPEILKLKDEIEKGEIGDVTSAMITFAVDLDSPYSGLWFYSSHLVEEMCTLFGYNVRSVMSFRSGNHLMAVARYDSFDVVLNFENTYTAVVYGTKGWKAIKTTCDGIYEAEFAHFAEMVKTGKSSMTAEQHIIPVRIIVAVKRSLETGREEMI